MKKTSFISILIALVFTGCNFSVGTKSDLISGLSYSWNALNAETIYFVNQEDQSITNKQVTWNTEC